jgi:branched-chain amino acid transport system substrate-binding protein
MGNGTRIILAVVASAAIATLGINSPTNAADPIPIKVGGASPLTGYMAADGNDMDEGLRMAIKEINDQGGLLGRPLELIPFDTEELLAESFAAAVEKLIIREKVDVIISGYSGEAGPDTFGKYDVPFLYNEGSVACNDVYRQNRKEYWNVFHTVDTSRTFGRLSFDMIQKLASDAGYKFPNKKIVTVWGGWNWDEWYAKGFGKRAEEKGWEVALIQETTTETKEWGATLARIREIDPAIIFVGIWGSAPPATFLLQFKQKPTNSLIVHNQSTINPEYLDMMGKKADGILDQAYHGVLPGPEGQAWLKRYKKMFGKELRGLMTVVTYDELMMWAEAVRRTGKADDYRAVAKALLDNPYKGLSGTYRFNKDHYSPTTPELPTFYYQYQGGKRVLLSLGSEKIVPVEGAKFKIPSWIK